MKIIICGSMKVCQKMIEMKNKLEKRNHTVLLPRHTEEYAEMKTSDHIHKESVKNKINHDLIRDYYNEISNGDAVLVVNEDLNNIKGYIGGNSFLEMGFAYVLNKKIFLLNEIPKMIYRDEIIAMQPTILNGDLRKIS
jgi:predicted RNA-binding protein with PUA domain